MYITAYVFMHDVDAILKRNTRIVRRRIQCYER